MLLLEYYLLQMELPVLFLQLLFQFSLAKWSRLLHSNCQVVKLLIADFDFFERSDSLFKIWIGYFL